MKFRLIANPRAGGGAAGRHLADISRALHRAGLAHEIAETRGPADATALAHRAREDGIEVIGVVGGDGTVNEVSQAYVDASGLPLAGPDIALVPFGTGGDFRRTFGLATGSADVVARIRHARPRPIDLGLVELRDSQGALIRRTFLNITSFGVGGQIDRIVNRSPKWIGGRAAFTLGSLRAFTTYRNAPVRVTVDGQSWFEGRVVNVAIANGQYFGGGMHVAPDADPSDGLFDMVAMGDLTLPEIIGVSARIYAGKHLSHPKVTTTRGTRIEAIALNHREPVLIDLDGEQPGQLPLIATVLPAALRILA